MFDWAHVLFVFHPKDHEERKKWELSMRRALDELEGLIRSNVPVDSRRFLSNGVTAGEASIYHVLMTRGYIKRVG
jgi:hypothetical protein